MSYSSVSGIQFPGQSGFRRDSPPHTGSVGQVGLAEARRASISASLASGIDSISVREREPRSVEFQDNIIYPTCRVNRFEFDDQRVKLYDVRKGFSAANFEDSNGAFFSNYLAFRTYRILEDYRQFKNDEEQCQGRSDVLRRGSSITDAYGMGQRSGSLTQLPQAQQFNQEGPIDQVEFFARENAKEHRTDRYEIVGNPRQFTPVYRRGQSFFMAVKVQNRAVDLNRQPLMIYFTFGSNPTLGKSTRIALTLNDDREFSQRDKSDWDIRLHHQEGNTLTIQVNVPPTAPVGVWSCEIQYNNENYYCQKDIYILFNPYCSEDSVYLDNEQFRREYVLSESGKLFTGTAQTQTTSKWVYGQFNEFILPITCLLLDRFTESNGEKISYSQRGSPVYIARALASLIHSKFGVLNPRGNPEENNYSQFSYTGSFSILEKLIQQDFRPVQVEQNFIASALFVTFCRALGIPARSLTTYRVPIERNTLNVDMYWDDENQRRSDLYEAYRCWNDVWMRRDDLLTPTLYVGWQAIDPNFQGFGPTPAESVRLGEVGLNFDVFHFYSLLNSQFRHFCANTYPEKVVTDDIGRLIVTKRCDRDDDDDEAEDVTQLYKKKEGSLEERLAVANSLKGTLQRRASGSLRALDKLQPNPIKELIVDWSYTNTPYGNNQTVSLLIQNGGSEARSLVINFFARPLYQSVVGRKIKTNKRQLILQPNQKECITLELTSQDYLDRLDNDYIIRFFATVYTKDTDQFWAGDEDVILLKPKINIQTRSVFQVDSEGQLNFTMANPLNIPLTDAYIFYEAAGAIKPVYRKIRDVKPGELLNINEKIIPKQAGDSRLVVIFHSRQLRNVVNSKQISVRE